MLLLSLPIFSIMAFLEYKIPDTLYLQPNEQLAHALQIDPIVPLSLSSTSTVTLGIIPIKKVTVQSVDENVVIPCGFPIGVAGKNDENCSIGMMTFYEPNSGNFAGFGHCADVTTSNMNAYSAKIDGIKTPSDSLGTLVAALGNKVGTVFISNESGVFGNIYSLPYLTKSTPIPLCPIDEISYGSATLLTTVDGDGERAYDIVISAVDSETQAYLTAENSTKSSATTADFMIEITDENLLSKTGGILRGMSGSPIIKDGKLIGALNQAIVENNKKGYGIFAKNMLSSADSPNYFQQIYPK